MLALKLTDHRFETGGWTSGSTGVLLPRVNWSIGVDRTVPDPYKGELCSSDWLHFYRPDRIGVALLADLMGAGYTETAYRSKAGIDPPFHMFLCETIGATRFETNKAGAKGLRPIRGLPIPSPSAFQLIAHSLFLTALRLVSPAIEALDRTEYPLTYRVKVAVSQLEKNDPEHRRFLFGGGSLLYLNPDKFRGDRAGNAVRLFSALDFFLKDDKNRLSELVNEAWKLVGYNPDNSLTVTEYASLRNAANQGVLDPTPD